MCVLDLPTRQTSSGRDVERQHVCTVTVITLASTTPSAPSTTSVCLEDPSTLLSRYLSHLGGPRCVWRIPRYCRAGSCHTLEDLGVSGGSLDTVEQVVVTPWRTSMCLEDPSILSSRYLSHVETVGDVLLEQHL